MAEKYYLDTSIWLDFFENRNEPNLPKGDWAHKLLNKITENNYKAIYSDIVILELGVAGYQPHEIEQLFEKIKPILIFAESTEKQARKAKDLSSKRNVPKGDALHAILARDNKATLVTLDNHFKKLLDITKPKRPQDLIWY
ncbi:PIN domain-containing protein [Candidatus Woesearchaeota archaeon]|nr:PIN domain-containing protein [Candidatus Woesearchaeota archaeon]